MWAIIKIDKKKINFFKKDFSKFFDSNFKISIIPQAAKHFHFFNRQHYEALSHFHFHSHLHAQSVLTEGKAYTSLVLAI